MSGFNVNNPDYQESPSGLVFNNGNAGIVTGVKVKITKKTEKDHEKSPDYKIFAWDKEQIANVNNLDEDKIYPVNKGIYYQQGEFKSKNSEAFYVKELRQLLRSVKHPMDDKDNFIFEKEFKDYNDFLDYTMNYVKEAIKKDATLEFDVVVDYGDDYKASQFLRLNGFPHWICKSGTEKLSLSRKAITERPKAEPKDDSPFIGESKTTTSWVD